MKAPLLALALLASPLLGATETRIKAYELLREWRYGAELPVPSEGISLTCENARWELTSGTIRLSEPLSDGRISGLVFRGQGRFRLSVPDPVERTQLPRFSGREGMHEIDTPITQLLFRSTSDLGRLSPKLISPGGALSADRVATSAQERWLRDFRYDADARLVAALGNGDPFVRAEVQSSELGSLTFTFDPEDDEEISLQRWTNGFPEYWLNLDRAADRREDGRHGARHSNRLHLVHVDLQADLLHGGSGAALGKTGERPTAGRFVVNEVVEAILTSNALTFQLDPEAHDLAVFDEREEKVAFVRDEIGRHFTDISNKENDSLITIFLTEPMNAGSRRTFKFSYELELPNYGFGDSWYPTANSGWNDRYSARMQFDYPKRDELHAVGKRLSEEEQSSGRRAVWIVEKPTPMLTFVMAQRFDQETVGGTPSILVFGPTSLTARNRLKALGNDVAQSLHFFGELFGDPLPMEAYSVTAIPARHGQSFEGFLEMSQRSFLSESYGPSQLFRAHEVAHQWFGHEIGWASYRDQWLSEAFAEYAAMMFVESTMKGGPQMFNEILSVDEGVLKGSLANGYSRFARPWLIQVNDSYRNRLGPIAQGFRASTREITSGYVIQTYMRGAMVLHMLRMALRETSGNDELFRTVLHDYVRSTRGTSPSTDEFRNIVEKVSGQPWGWFFEQWVEHSEVPSINWRHRLEQRADGLHLLVTLRQSGTESLYRLPVPLTLHRAGGTTIVTLLLREEEKSFDLPVESGILDVTINDDYALLANISRK